jgi:hypothetical protein
MSIKRKGDDHETIITPANPYLDITEKDVDWPRVKPWLDLGYMVVDELAKDEPAPSPPKAELSDKGSPVPLSRDEIYSMRKEQLVKFAARWGVNVKTKDGGEKTLQIKAGGV